jgi:hypothetical protein
VYPPIVARQQLGKRLPEEGNKHPKMKEIWTRGFLGDPNLITGSRLLLLPRISCLISHSEISVI